MLKETVMTNRVNKLEAELAMFKKDYEDLTAKVNAIKGDTITSNEDWNKLNKDIAITLNIINSIESELAFYIETV